MRISPFSSRGYRLDGLALEVYLPDESEPVEMDYVDTDMLASGTPVRREVLIGDSFPLGNYFFHVHIDDETYKFMWRRSDDSMNALSLSCLGREEVDEDDSETSEAVTEAPALDDDIEVRGRAVDGDPVQDRREGLQRAGR